MILFMNSGGAQPKQWRFALVSPKRETEQMATLTVGVDKQFQTIAEAVRNTQAGDVVKVDAGIYTNDFFTVYRSITLESVGGMAILEATTEPGNGKGIIVGYADLVVDGFGFTGAAVGDGNGAGIRFDNGNLVVRNSLFWDNQDGILAPNAGTILIDNSEFSHNGLGDGYTHNIYVGAIQELTITNSYFHDAVVGHEIKSRAYKTNIINNRIMDNDGNASYSIDLPNGGVGLIQGNVIEKGANAPNWITIHYGGESAPYEGSHLEIVGNTIVNDNPNGYFVANAAGSPTLVTGNAIYGYATDHLAILGPVTMQDNTFPGERPELDLSSIAPVVVPPPPEAVYAPVPEETSLQVWGAEGMVQASGRVLTVGAGGQFATFYAAMSKAVDGDTIQIAAGTYVNDYGVIDKKVIVEGVGGMARFVQQNFLDSNQGIFVVNTDATLRNLEIMGGHNYSGRVAGIMVQGGHVTIANSYIHDNDIGINASDNARTGIVMIDTEVAHNGNDDRGTPNMVVGAVGSVVIQNSTIHGAFSGHELTSRAFNALIENNRIYDGVGNPASFLLNIAQGGNTVIRNNILEKGEDSANGILIRIAGEGRAYSNTDVEITDNMLITRLHNPDHPYTYFIVGNDEPNVDASRNTFVGGVPGSTPLYKTAGTDNVSLRLMPGAAFETTPTWSAERAASAFHVEAKGPNVLTLMLSEQRQEVDAQFLVYVDGLFAGSGLVTAAHSAGQTQSFEFHGWWGAGNHAITVSALNVTSHRGPAAAALFVEKVDLDGYAVQAQTPLYFWAPETSVSVEGTNKVPGFDAAYYLRTYSDVRLAGMDPLQHYLTYGAAEGRNPSAFFNTRYYMLQNPDVADARVNPLVHYETVGWKEGRDPSYLFSTAAYLEHNPDVAAVGMDPLFHYLSYGQAEGRATYAATPKAVSSDPLVNATWYYAQNPSAAARGPDAAEQFHTYGWQVGYDPNPWFSTSYYMQHNPDVFASGLDPLKHYEAFGAKEGRDVSPWFSTKAYVAAHQDLGDTNPLLAFLQSGEAGPVAGINAYAPPEAALFDIAFYTARHPEVAQMHMDPLVHFESLGWQFGYDPSAAFSTTKYLAAYSDVKAANMDPLYHYANWGAAEGRQAFNA